MIIKQNVIKLLPVAAMAVALGGMSGAAVAASSQVVDIHASKLETVIRSHSRTGIQQETVRMSRQVSYAGLDLATPEGAHELTSRIHNTAAFVCDRLSALYFSGTAPGELRDRAACVQGAVAGAMEQAKVVIASAERERSRR